MTQNVYDDPGFFAASSQVPRSVHGLAGAPEWPALRALLPPLAGRRVLDLGCGFGWFCRWTAERGAVSALGLDLSERILARARDMTRHPAMRYRRAGLEQADLPESGFDVCFSSLALHYVRDCERPLAAVHGALAPGGHLVASVEHPVFTAPARRGWLAGPDGRRTWPVDRYLAEGPRVTDWLSARVTRHASAVRPRECSSQATKTSSGNKYNAWRVVLPIPTIAFQISTRTISGCIPIPHCPDRHPHAAAASSARATSRQASTVSRRELV